MGRPRLQRKSGGSLYMGQALIDANGKPGPGASQAETDPCGAHGVRRGRRQPPDGLRNGIGNVGSLCCWEHLQPLSKYAMYAQNEQCTSPRAELFALPWRGFRTPGPS